ncbi:RNA 3'-terminal phosphate cyclase [Porphyridium purpureum]|uniref:RNA 3'-terminal phosphate cyclase n=1 Tax=Porphyridium purpureum TaxID=35688 RepID=A0A5J4YM39_PORPP|nr:RNA 3'-terminal phosphate cyclase [Porphyridium purpureum]|eukprot:POR3302..scf244_11
MTVDGAQGEGGGQVLRYAMTCSALTGIPVRVINIRANRPKGGGLRAQHLESAKIVAELTGGCFLEKSLTEGSTELVFDPRGSAASLSGRGSAASLSGRGTRRGGEIQGHASTAASITLMLQAALIPAYMRSTENDPVHVVGPMVRHFGIHLDVKCRRVGYYPRGGGSVRATVSRTSAGRERLQGVQLVGGRDPARKVEFVHVHGYFAGRPIPQDTAEGVITLIEHHMKEELCEFENKQDEFHKYDERLLQLSRAPYEINFRRPLPDSLKDVGYGIVAAVGYNDGSVVGADCLSDKFEFDTVVVWRKVDDDLERLTATILNDVMAGATVDIHMADMCVPLMMAAEGTSAVLFRGPPSSHLETAVRIASQFGGKFSMKELIPAATEHCPGWPGNHKVGALWELRCEGLGLSF